MKNDLPPTNDSSFFHRLKQPKVFIPVAVCILLYIALNIAVYLYGPKLFQQGYLNSLFSTVTAKPVPSLPAPTPTPTPTPRPIPHGPIDFSVGQGNKTVPQYGKVTIDPYDPATGATQSATLTVKHPQPVTSVTATLRTDHSESAPVAFTLISGTNTNGTWKGSWTVTDSYLYVYQIVFVAKSADGKSARNVLTLR